MNLKKITLDPSPLFLGAAASLEGVGFFFPVLEPDLFEAAAVDMVTL
jgi:hypothetical protein